MITLELEFKSLVKRSIEEIAHRECRESDAGKNFILKEFSEIKDKMLEAVSELERSATVLQGKGKDAQSVSRVKYQQDKHCSHCS